MAKHRWNDLSLWLCLMLAIPASAWGQTALSSAHIRGVVARQDGTPVPGATIAYHRVVQYLPSTDPFWSHWPPLAPGEAYVDGELTAEQNGYFDIGGLPGGDYLLCARGPAAGYLDPCDWSRPIGVAGLVAGEVRDIPSIQLTTGAILTIHVNDPAGLLSPTDQLTSDPGIIVGVQRDDGGFYRAEPGAATASGRDFQITVPYNLPLRLWVFSRALSVSDQLGNTLNRNGTWIPFQIPSGQLRSSFNLSVAAGAP